MMLSSSAVVGCVDKDWKTRRTSSPLESWSPAAPGELSTQSEEFRTRSAAHDVRLHQTGAKHVHHPVVGDLSLTFEMLGLRADPGLTILTYTAEPGSNPRRRSTSSGAGQRRSIRRSRQG